MEHDCFNGLVGAIGDELGWPIAEMRQGRRTCLSKGSSVGRHKYAFMICNDYRSTGQMDDPFERQVRRPYRI